LAGRAKPPPQAMVDAATPSRATRQARCRKSLRERHFLPGNNSSKAAKTGAPNGHCGCFVFPEASCVVVWTVMVDWALEPPGVTDAGEKVMVPPGRPVAVRATGLVKLPLVDDTLTV